MRKVLKIWLRLGFYSLFYLTAASSIVGIFLTTLYVAEIVKNFEILVTYYTVVSFGGWLLTIPMTLRKSLGKIK